MFDLTGKLALVTGAGAASASRMAEALAGAGADIIGVSLDLETGASEVTTAGRGRWALVHAATASTSRDREQVGELAATIASLDRPLDILVNNAGTIVRAPAVDTWRRRLGHACSRPT